MYRDTSHLWHSFSHNRTKINSQFLSTQLQGDPHNSPSPTLDPNLYSSWPYKFAGFNASSIRRSSITWPWPYLPHAPHCCDVARVRWSPDDLWRSYITWPWPYLPRALHCCDVARVRWPPDDLWRSYITWPWPYLPHALHCCDVARVRLPPGGWSVYRSWGTSPSRSSFSPPPPETLSVSSPAAAYGESLSWLPMISKNIQIK